MEIDGDYENFVTVVTPKPLRAEVKDNTLTLEQLEKAIYDIAKKPFRIDITTEYKDKSIYVDFGFGVHFENEGTHIDDIFKSVLTQIQGYFNERA